MWENETKQKLEELLNILCDKWWNPFYWEIKNKWWVRGNYPCKWVIKIRKNTVFISYRYESWNERITKWKKVQHSIRELTSLSSWLWQYVCKNGMEEMAEWFYWQNIFPLDSIEYEYVDYQYWIIESALKDESELEKFLLNSIKID